MPLHLEELETDESVELHHKDTHKQHNSSSHIKIYKTYRTGEKVKQFKDVSNQSINILHLLSLRQVNRKAYQASETWEILSFSLAKN